MGYIADVLTHVVRRNPLEREFHQAVQEVLDTLAPVLDRHPEYEDYRVLERMVEPERVVVFRVPWQDDRNRVRINRGYRVEFNSALGPYKGGLRFHPSTTLGTFKFMAFQQTFKNALTMLPLGGADGGSDFGIKDKTGDEVMRFCQSFMTELHRHIGPDTDIPAGDIGVGPREIGYLFGQYKRIRNEFSGVLTGKNRNWGGSLIRPEASGYGLAYFAQAMLETRGDSLNGKRCAVSGSGNVALYAVEKISHLGGMCISLSDSSGTIHDPSGITEEKLAYIMELKNVRRDRLREYAVRFPDIEYREGARPWGLPCDCAFPCAMENELEEKDAAALVDHGCFMVCEGANMPCTQEAIALFHENGVLFGPGKAANAGGVAVSGLEMAQNATHIAWSKGEIETRLRELMSAIHRQAYETADDYGRPGNYLVGANIAAFTRLADAMLDQGIV